MATRIGKLTSIWKSYNDEVVGLEEDIRIAYSKIKRLDAKIENIQSQIAFLQKQE